MPKNDGTLWLRMDFQGLYKLTNKYQYPLLLIYEVTDQLSGARYFKLLDISEAYHRLRIVLGDKWNTSFCMRYDHY